MDLAKTQFVSLAAKAVTTALGIIQSVIVVRLLSPAEFGLVGLVMSIGGVIGVSQHLGIVDGAIREIAVRNKKKDIGTIVWASHIVRQAVTIPLSLILFFIAPYIAAHYGYPNITPYIRIFSAVLVLQGLQDVWGATLTGMKRFVPLYVIQIITATVNIAVFSYLTWRYGTVGFFWAVVVTTAIMVVLLAASTIRSLTHALNIPTWADLRSVARQIIRIGMYTYVARIFFVIWQRLPLLVLGGALLTDELGYLNISMTFGSKLIIIAAALSEVNLSWMSSLFVADRKQFALQATKNMHRVLILMVGLTLVLLFFTPEMLRYVVGAQYLPAEPIIILMTCAFFLYALIDIGTSSIFVPADNPRQRTLIFGILTAISTGLLFWLLAVNPSPLLAAGAMTGSAAASFVAMVVIARKYGVHMAPPALIGLLVLLGASAGWLFYSPTLMWRIPVFLLLMAYVAWETKRLRLLPDLRKLFSITSATTSTTAKTSTIICFAGAAFHTAGWTNRQHIMSRMSKKSPVLYVEPRVWIFRYLLRNMLRPKKTFSFLKRIFWKQSEGEHITIISQWNLFPGSRESNIVSTLNHWLNRHVVLAKARLFGFKNPIIWIYDTEAAEYLSAFPEATVVYDCVDNHAAQAGVDRNSNRVVTEERRILSRADLVTTTSKSLFNTKKQTNPNTHLVLNAGDVAAYSDPIPAPETLSSKLVEIKTLGPVLGSVGAIDGYKIDFDLIARVAKDHPAWQFVFIGRPVVGGRRTIPKEFRKLGNIHLLGEVDRKHVPALVHQFDVCLIPYRHNKYNQASFPLKFWEFMATGKPIVVTGTPELKQFSEHISYSKNMQEFVRAITAQLKDGQQGAEDRKKLAATHSWEHRAARLEALLRNTIKD